MLERIAKLIRKAEAGEGDFTGFIGGLQRAVNLYMAGPGKAIDNFCEEYCWYGLTGDGPKESDACKACPLAEFAEVEVETEAIRLAKAKKSAQRANRRGGSPAAFPLEMRRGSGGLSPAKEG